MKVEIHCFLEDLIYFFFPHNVTVQKVQQVQQVQLGSWSSGSHSRAPLLSPNYILHFKGEKAGRHSSLQFLFAPM